MDFDHNVLTAPVTLTASVECMWERAQPHSRVTVRKGSRQSVVNGRDRRDPLVEIRVGLGPSPAEITDPDADGRYELILRSRDFWVGKTPKPSSAN